MFTDVRTHVRTDGQTTDGHQAHRYIPRTFRSGGKNDTSGICILPLKLLEKEVSQKVSPE